MTKAKFRADIKNTSKSVIKTCKKTLPEGEKTIEINRSLPYVAIQDGKNKWFFQGDEASDLLEEAEDTSEKFNVTVEEVIIWRSQGW